MTGGNVNAKFQQLSAVQRALVEQVRIIAEEYGQPYGYAWAPRSDYLGFGPSSHEGNSRPVLVSLKPKSRDDRVLLRIQPIHDRGGDRFYSMRELDPPTTLAVSQTDDASKCIDTVRLKSNMDFDSVTRMLLRALQLSTHHTVRIG